MQIALFADVHGRVELCFKLCARWQQETGLKLDYILQAGDLGAFFDRARLDKATIRYAQQDPSELGFLEHFTVYHPRTAAVLSATTCPMFFVRGNHEDHAVLDRLEQQHSGPAFPVDVYERIWCLKSGIPQHLTAQQASLHMLGIGRIGPVAGVTDLRQAKYVHDGIRHRLWDVDPTTTDAERATWNVPPLAEQRCKAEEATRIDPPQPINLDDAPWWLKEALLRWRASTGLSEH